MALPEATYHQILVESGLIKEEDFARAREVSHDAGRALEAALVDIGLFTNDQIGRLVADAYGVPFVNLGRTTIAPEAFKVIPELVVKRQEAIGYAIREGKLFVAMVDPHNVEFAGFVEKKSGMPVVVGYTTPALLEDSLRAFAEDIVGKMQKLAVRFEELRKESAAAREEEGQDVVVQIVDLLLQYGYNNNASDVHIEPQEKQSLVRYRIDGLLHDVITFPKPLHDAIISRVKILSNLRTDEHYAAQDGKLRVRLEGKMVDVRVSIMPIVDGEKAVWRILSEKGRTYTIETLGFSPADQKRVRAAAEKPYGMILATGPTGSGKTTSMYALLKILNTRDVNIQTIEDPVEYDMEGVNQIQVNLRTNLTFASGLRSIVRQDPDIIMVGEIRDAETAGIAVNAAMTGHLVLSTLHTNDAATTIPRLLDMDVEPFLVASSVNVVVAQRLVRRICASCISSVSINAAKIKSAIPKDLFKKYFDARATIRQYVGKGCTICNHTGFVGRVGIFEVLEVTPSIRELIVQRADAGVIAAQAVKEGMTTMFEDGLRKVVEGVTTIEEVLRVAKIS